MLQGAGGTQGGMARFFIGLAMLVGGGYLFLTSIRVGTGFNWGSGLFGIGGFTLTSGMILIPFIFGIGIIFFNAKNVIGWVLACGSLLALAFGIIRNVQLSLIPMTAFDLLIILVLVFGGIGLLLSALRDAGSQS